MVSMMCEVETLKLLPRRFSGVSGFLGECVYKVQKLDGLCDIAWCA